VQNTLVNMVEVVVVSNDAFFVHGMLSLEPRSNDCMVKFNFLHSDHLVSESAFFLGV